MIGRQRHELAVSVVNEAHRSRQPKFHRPTGHRQRVVRIAERATEHGVHVHAEGRMTRQHRQFLVENLEALLGGLVRHDVVDADLQVVEARVVQAFDPPLAQQVAVRDEPREHPVRSDAADDGVELLMEQRLATAELDRGGAETRQVVDPLEHRVEGHRW